MTLYSKEAKRKSEEKFAAEWIHENVSHYEGENGSISIEGFFKLSPHERSKGKYKGVFKKDIPVEPVGKLEEKEGSEAREWELWRDFLYIVGSKRYLLHGDDFMGTNWEDLMGILKSEGFTITRKQPL